MTGSLGLFGLLGPGRKQAVGRNFKDTRQGQKFIVSHTAQLRFDLGQGSTADVQPVQLALGGKCLLCEAKLVAPLSDLRPDDVGRCLGSGHWLEKSSLTVAGNRPGICYAFLANRQRCLSAIAITGDEKHGQRTRLG